MLIPSFILGGTAYGLEGAVNNSNVPTAISGSMTFRVYVPNGFITNGTATLFGSPDLTAVYKWSVTTSDPDYERGVVYDVVLSYTVSGNARNSIHRFMVI